MSTKSLVERILNLNSGSTELEIDAINTPERKLCAAVLARALQDGINPIPFGHWEGTSKWRNDAWAWLIDDVEIENGKIKVSHPETPFSCRYVLRHLVDDVDAAHQQIIKLVKAAQNGLETDNMQRVIAAAGFRYRRTRYKKREIEQPTKTLPLVCH